MEPEWRNRLAALLGPNDLLLTGGVKLYVEYEDKGGYQSSKLLGANNSLWVLTPDSRLIGRYDKAHLVPYGEYLPLRTILAPLGLSRLVPGDVDFWPGSGPPPLMLPAPPGPPPPRMPAPFSYELILPGNIVATALRPVSLFNPS